MKIIEISTYNVFDAAVIATQFDYYDEIKSIVLCFKFMKGRPRVTTIESTIDGFNHRHLHFFPFWFPKKYFDHIQNDLRYQT